MKVISTPNGRFYSGKSCWFKNKMQRWGICAPDFPVNQEIRVMSKEAVFICSVLAGFS